MHQLQTNKRTIIKVAQGTKIFSYSINNKNEKIREKEVKTEREKTKRMREKLKKEKRKKKTKKQETKNPSKIKRTNLSKRK